MRETNHLYFAAYLKASGFELKGTRRDGARVFFLFGRSVITEKERFFAGTVNVNALRYSEEVKALKALVH